MAVTADDVTDEKLLPGRFDAFAAEMRTAFEMLGNKILPAITRVETAFVDAIERVAKLERRQDKADDRAERLAKRIAAVEKTFQRKYARKAKNK